MSEASELELLDALGDVFFAFGEDGTLELWNRAAVEVTGYPEPALAGMEPTDFFEGEDAERVATAATEVAETGEAVVEAALVTADGERIPYEFNVRRLPGEGPAAFAGIGRDVTERHRRREKLEHRERVLREMYEVIADRTRSFDEQVGSLLALGRAELETDYGTLSRIEGEDYVFEIVDVDDDSIQAGDVVPLAATNCELAASEERTLVLGDVARDAPAETDRAGYEEWGISCYIGSPVFVDDDVYGTFCFYDTEPREEQFSEWEVTLVDLMSQWVSYELQRKRANDRLQGQNERLERFASTVSHDLRNPLSVVLGSIELAEETGDVDELARARRALERMDTIIDDLLTLSKAGNTIDETEPVDLGALVATCRETVPTENATVRVESDRTVRADRTRLQQLLENLLRNAVEHGSTGSRTGSDDAVEHGSTSNRTGSDDAIEHGGDGVTVRVGALESGFYVEDDGPGIPEDKRQNVFESGYSTTCGGTGFGLAIVAEIASAHGWDVEIVEGELGGARFEFTGVEG